jgi:hypothetical protein
MEKLLGNCDGYQVLFEMDPGLMHWAGHDAFEFARYVMELDCDLVAEVSSEDRRLIKIDDLDNLEQLIRDLLSGSRQGEIYTNLLVSRNMALSERSHVLHDHAWVHKSRASS